MVAMGDMGDNGRQGDVEPTSVDTTATLDKEDEDGLFATVRKCTHRETGIQYAAKFSSRMRCGVDCSMEILHEIAMLYLGNESNKIVHLKDVFQNRHEIILVLEYAPGGDFQTVLDEDMVPFEEDVQGFLKQILEALKFIHDKNIAHLDIKPQNIVLMGQFPNCEIKLCDLEVARVIQSGESIREIIGTPDYVAPEILSLDPITLASDIWSLGVLAYVLLTGFSPFGGDTDQETLRNISTASLDFPPELFEGVSDQAKNFIAQCLDRKPSARPTVKECLLHEWLIEDEEPPSPSPLMLKIPAPDTFKMHHAPHMGSNNHANAHSATGGASRRSCQTCRDRVTERKRYLSKSREAIFEKVSQSNLKKSLSKSRERLCDIRLTISKSRDYLNERAQMQKNISKSQDKLTNFKSVSKSQEVISNSLGGAMKRMGNGTGAVSDISHALFSLDPESGMDLLLLPGNPILLNNSDMIRLNNSLQVLPMSDQSCMASDSHHGNELKGGCKSIGDPQVPITVNEAIPEEENEEDEEEEEATKPEAKVTAEKEEKVVLRTHHAHNALKKTSSQEDLERRFLPKEDTSRDIRTSHSETALDSRRVLTRTNSIGVQVNIAPYEPLDPHAPTKRGFCHSSTLGDLKGKLSPWRNELGKMKIHKKVSELIGAFDKSEQGEVGPLEDLKLKRRGSLQIESDVSITSEQVSNLVSDKSLKQQRRKSTSAIFNTPISDMSILSLKEILVEKSSKPSPTEICPPTDESKVPEGDNASDVPLSSSVSGALKPKRTRNWDYFEIDHPKAISEKKLQQLKAKYLRRKTESSITNSIIREEDENAKVRPATPSGGPILCTAKTTVYMSNRSNSVPIVDTKVTSTIRETTPELEGLNLEDLSQPRVRKLSSESNGDSTDSGSRKSSTGSIRKKTSSCQLENILEHDNLEAKLPGGGDISIPKVTIQLVKANAEDDGIGSLPHTPTEQKTEPMLTAGLAKLRLDGDDGVFTSSDEVLNATLRELDRQEEGRSQRSHSVPTGPSSYGSSSTDSLNLSNTPLIQTFQQTLEKFKNHGDKDPKPDGRMCTGISNRH
eukprot:snap_masked-scaffold438_size171652-processed-gene-0.7 protein:Tk03133 transcript:snap_masked-scaffold438_size171652-processed-gene-0.7-mRNA-1 annotation:"death associated protein"